MSDPKNREETARRVFADYVVRVGLPENAEFESICQEHPELVEQLRKLHSNWQQKTVGATQAISARIKEKYGAEDPSVAIEDEGETPTAFTDEVISRLASHKDASTRYRIKGEIARGGMGAILRVWDADLRRHLAMKVILGSGESRTGDTPEIDARTVGRFLEEAQVTSQLNHPGVVPVHELGLDEDGRVYFTMRLVKGRELKEIFQLAREEEDGWNLSRALSTLLKVCEAVAYAHDKGVIHRDLKPSNVMVGNYGEVYVMDWGLAKVLGQDDRHDLRLASAPSATRSAVGTDRRDAKDSDTDSPLITMDGTVIGTPAYMAPEQARGEVENVACLSDVYAVGAMLYELLTGQSPYVPPGSRMSAHTILASVLRGPPQPVHEIVSDVQAELEAICDKAMARRQEDRYPDTGELAEDLRAYLEGRVVYAHEKGAWAEARKWVQRNKPLAASLVAAVILSLGGAIGIAYVQAAGRRVANEQREIAQDQAAIAVRLSYDAFVHAARGALDDGNFSEARRLHALCPAIHRNWEWDHLKLRLHPALLVLEGHPSGVTSVDWSPDGKRIVSGAQRGPAHIWDASNGELLRLLEGPDRARLTTVVWSPDGNRIVSSADNQIQVWSASNGEMLQSLKAGDRYHSITPVAWNAQGTRIAWASRDRTVRIWDARSGENLLTLEQGGSGRLTAVAWNARGTRILSASVDRTVRIWDARSGEDLRTLELGNRGNLTAVAWNVSSERLVGASSGVLRVWDTKNGEVLQSWHRGRLNLHTMDLGPDGHRIVLTDFRGKVVGAEDVNPRSPFKFNDDVTSVAWSPDGTRIASGWEDNTVRVWDTVTEDLRTLEGHGDKVACLSWSPDGTRIVSGSDDATLFIWDAATRGSTHTLKGHRLLVDSVAWNPDGTRIVSGAQDQTVRVWEANTGEPLLTLEGSRGRVVVRWSPDGTRIASGAADLRVWDSVTGASLLTLEGHANGVESIAWSPDGSRIASRSSDGQTRVWDAASGEELLSLESSPATWRDCLAWSPDGTVIVGGQRQLIVWSASSGKRLRKFKESHGLYISSIAWCPDGTRVATASWDNTLRVWDLASGSSLLNLKGHSDIVHAVAWNSDGTRIVSASEDGTLRVWNAENGQSLLTLRGDADSFRSVAWSPDGKRIVSGDSDGSLRIWESRREEMEAIWHARETEDRASSLVQMLFQRHVMLDLVMDAIDDSDSLPGEVRELSCEKARLRGESPPNDISTRAWSLVDPDRDDRAADVELGLRLARRAVELDPGNELSLDTLAHALFANGQYDEALVASEKAHACSPPQDKDEFQGYLDHLKEMIDEARNNASTKKEEDE